VFVDLVRNPAHVDAIRNDIVTRAARYTTVNAADADDVVLSAAIKLWPGTRRAS
jgi:hypothetical protein